MKSFGAWFSRSATQSRAPACSVFGLAGLRLEAAPRLPENTTQATNKQQKPTFYKDGFLILSA